MTARPQKIDAVDSDEVYQTVFLINAPRPHTRAKRSQGFRLADSAKWIPPDSVNQGEYSEREATVIFDPGTQVVQELRVNDRLSA